jgi:hypothetical protein
MSEHSRASHGRTGPLARGIRASDPCEASLRAVQRCPTVAWVWMARHCGWVRWLPFPQGAHPLSSREAGQVQNGSAGGPCGFTSRPTRRSCTAPSLDQALGRSRGGFSTKIHVRCNATGLPIGIVLSDGETDDVTAYDGLMQQRDSDPGAMLADKGYDSDSIRLDLLDSGATPEIPTKSNRKVQYSVSKPLYALRSRIECFIGHLKEQRSRKVPCSGCCTDE